jgi:hypothetical protein
MCVLFYGCCLVEFCPCVKCNLTDGIYYLSTIFVVCRLLLSHFLIISLKIAANSDLRNLMEYCFCSSLTFVSGN